MAGAAGMSETRRSLRTLLGNHPTTRALRQGLIASPLLDLDLIDVPVPNKAFKRVVRDLEFDVAELALMTFLMARSRDVPLRLLPVALFSRNPLPLLICNVARRRLLPGDLASSRIGVRSYTTTTAVWIRALVSDQFGVAFDTAHWLTLEEGHVAGVLDPPNVQRATATTDLITMLTDGALDAVIVDPVPSAPQFAGVVPDPDTTYRSWKQRHGARTINHVVTVHASIADDPGVVHELFRLFSESRNAGGAEVDRASTPIGLAAMRPTLETAIRVADEQSLLARPLPVDELLTDAIASLD